MSSPFDTLAAQFTQPGLPVGGLMPSQPPSWVNPLNPTIPASTAPLPNAMPTSGTATPAPAVNLQRLRQAVMQTPYAPSAPARTANPPLVTRQASGPMTGSVAPHQSPNGVVPFPMFRP